MAAPIKILHIAETIKGGIASYLNQVVPELGLRPLAGQLPKQRLLVPETDTCYLKAIPTDQLLPFVRNGRGIMQLLRFALVCREAIKRYRPDIVFLHSTFAGAIVRAQLPLNGVTPKVVYCAHGWAFEASRSPTINRLIASIELKLARRTDRIVTLSDSETSDCLKLGFPVEKLTRVYNGISQIAPHSDRAHWNDDRLKVLFVGRLDRQKGVDTLFAAAALTPEQLCIRCAGDAVVARRSIGAVPENVQMLGWLSPEELQAQLLAADIVAMPSRWEGLGIAAIEAMRAARPVVGSNIGGLREVIEDGVTGWLVPAENPAALLAALLKPDANARRAAGDAGRKRFEERFTLKRCVDGLHAVLDELVS